MDNIKLTKFSIILGQLTQESKTLEEIDCITNIAKELKKLIEINRVKEW